MSNQSLVLSLLLALASGQGQAAGAMPWGAALGQGLRSAEPAAYASDLSRVAQAMGTSLAVAAEARHQNLEETLSWVLMRCSVNAGVSVLEIMQRRKTKSWGEVTASCGLNWALLVKDLRQRSEGAGLLPTPASATQIMRSASNDPERLAKLESVEKAGS